MAKTSLFKRLAVYLHDRVMLAEPKKLVVLLDSVEEDSSAGAVVIPDERFKVLLFNIDVVNIFPPKERRPISLHLAVLDESRVVEEVVVPEVSLNDLFVHLHCFPNRLEFSIPAINTDSLEIGGAPACPYLFSKIRLEMILRFVFKNSIVRSSNRALSSSGMSFLLTSKLLDLKFT